MQDTIFDKLTDAGIGVKKFDDLEYLLLKRISRVKSYPVAPYQNNMVRSTLARPRTSNTLKEALGWAISATEDSNQKAASYALLAEIQTLYSRRKEALGALEKARKIDPKDQDYIRVKNILFPNHVLAAESPKELALKRLQTISETSPEKLSQERPSLDVLVKSQLYAEASEFCQTILEKEPSNAEIAALHKTCVEERLKAATAEAHEKLKTPAPF